MTFKRAMAASTMAAGIGLAGLLGAGLGTASANPGPPCGQPNAPACAAPHNDRGPAPAPADWGHRGVDQGRRDHQPFNWNGQRVTPMRAGNGDGWGFWFLGHWIRSECWCGEAGHRPR